MKKVQWFLGIVFSLALILVLLISSFQFAAYRDFGFYEKAFRGFFAASYSLLTDVGVYPVINGSVFYLDDFPSPVPNGDGTYIKRDYGTSIADFYTNIWWPDMIALATTHNVQYTGVIIENYEDETDGETERQDDVQRFQYFGSASP